MEIEQSRAVGVLNGSYQSMLTYEIKPTSSRARNFKNNRLVELFIVMTLSFFICGMLTYVLLQSFGKISYSIVYTV